MVINIMDNLSLRLPHWLSSKCSLRDIRWMHPWVSAFFAVVIIRGIMPSAVSAADSWPQMLAEMPLKETVSELNRTNCVEIMLGAFKSNSLVKALIFMPGATDEFYLFRRASARLRNPAATLLDAVSALTNQTNIRASFRAPLLLLHTDEDPLEPDEIIRDERTGDKLRSALVPHLVCNDKDWDYLQPLLKQALKVALRPWRYSTDSWHFYRHSFASWNLTGFEALETAALAGKSKFTIRRNEVDFEVDPRVRARPSFDIHLR
jgi:hypothetical protein